MTDARRTRLTLVTGLRRDQTELVADKLHATGAAVVHHDLTRMRDGLVERRVRVGDRDERTVVELAHGCVSCTLREDLLPLLRALAGRLDDVVVHLDPLVEPEPVCLELVAVDADVEAVIAVVDMATWLEAATSDDDLDDRTVAQVAVGQVEFADAVVTAGPSELWLAARTEAVLDRLAPGAPRAWLSTVDPKSLLASLPPSARRGEVTDAHAPLLRGEPPLDADCGVALTVYRARRPFHPGRLHEAIDALLEGVVRTRGRVWVASQPNTALWLESAGGGLRVGHAGAWLAALPDEAWDRADPDRRTAAAVDWDPIFGDRVQELAILTHLANPAEITAELDRALLTDAELALGEPTWAAYADPFNDWHPVPARKESP